MELKKIRSWLRKAEAVRRTVVEAREEKDAERRELIRLDVRHGILPMAGRVV